MQAEEMAREHGSAVHRSLGALVAAAVMMICLHDWFEPLTILLSWGTVAAVAGGVALAVLATRHGRAEGRPSRWHDWSARVAGSAVALALLAVHLQPGWHSTARLAVVLGAATALGCAALMVGRWGARPAICVLAAAFTLMLATPLSYQNTPFFSPRDLFFAVTVLATFLFLAAAPVTGLSTRAILAGVIVAGTLMRAHGILNHAINAVHRDMLPLAQYAGERFLSGANPYGTIYWANHDLPLTYLPVLWLTYLPALAAGVDVRWVTVIVTALIAVVVLRWAEPVGGRCPYGGLMGRARTVGELTRGILGGCIQPVGQVTSAEAGLGAVAVTLMLAPEVVWNAIHGEPIVYWFWLVLFLDAVRADRKPRAALLLGILVATRHFAILVVPFAALWFVLGRQGYRRGVLWLLVAGAVACAIVMPFFTANPDTFLFGTYDWLLTYGPSRRTWWAGQIGLSQYFYVKNAESALPVYQWTAVGAAFIVAAGLVLWAHLRRRSAPGVDSAAFLPLVPAYAAFVLLNTMIWKSFLFPVLLLVVFAAALRTRTQPPARTGGCALERWLMVDRRYYLVVAALGAFLAWSGYTVTTALRAHHDITDVVMHAHHASVHDVQSGDLLVDWSVPYAGHVKGRSAFEGLYLPPGVQRVNRMRAQPVMQHERVVLFDGFGWFDPEGDFPDLERVTSRTVGRSSVHVFRPAHVMDGSGWKLTDHPEVIQSVVLVSDTPPSPSARLVGNRWEFAGMHPWNGVGPANLLVMGGPMAAIWAHPAQDMVLRITLDLPVAGPAMMVTAMNDFAIRPLHPPVHVKVEQTSTSETTSFDHPNRVGGYFWGLGRLLTGEVVVEVTCEKADMRPFGFELMVDQDG